MQSIELPLSTYSAENDTIMCMICDRVYTHEEFEALEDGTCVRCGHHVHGHILPGGKLGGPVSFLPHLREVRVA